MNNVLTVHMDSKPIYDIILETTFDSLVTQVMKLGVSSRRALIVTETTVAAYYLARVQTLLESCFSQVEVYIFPAGEHSKNLDTVNQVYQKLIDCQFDRKDMLIALGGGVVGDLTGFAAATYLRGVDFIQIPTSLLAQVDSSIGGKTGVDYRAYKNMVGAFYQPKLVYINVSVLDTLSDREFNSGLGEVIKHGLIRDKEYYLWIEEHKEEILARKQEIILPMIYRSCEIKGEIVEVDPKEQGVRALLNFGHTLGHSIEKLMDFTLLHGECVVQGCILAGMISKNRNLISIDEYQSMQRLFEFFSFPKISASLHVDEVLAATKLDKKMEANVIKFILLDQIGEAYMDQTVSEKDMKEALEEYMAEVVK